MSIVERIQNNDPDLLELRLTEAPEAYCASMSDFIAALEQNTVVDYIRIDRDFLPCMDQAYVPQFFAAMGKLKGLKEVHIWHATFPVKDLSGFLEAARSLDYLEFGCLELAGSEEDHKVIADLIKDHPALRVFYMVDFSLSADGPINHLVESLSSVPNLEVVKLEVTSSRRRSLCGSEAAAVRPSVQLSGKALAALCGSKTLRELQLNRVSLKKDDFADLAEALKTSPALTSLSLPHCDIDDDACSHLASAIAVTDKLEKIDFSCNKLTDEGCILIASALKGNKSVKMLRLWGNVKISNAGFDALVEMLEVNCHLERVPLMAPLEYGNKIDAKLVKNRAQNNRAA